MFHKPTGHIAALLMLLSVSSQPLLAHASEDAAPAAVAHAEAVPVATQKASLMEDYSFETFRNDARMKLSDTQSWMKDKTQLHDYENPIKTLEVKIDRLQDQVNPVGRSIKSSAMKHARGTGIIQKGDRMFSAFGFMLFAAFGLVFVMMSLSGPASRLGGRH